MILPFTRLVVLALLLFGLVGCSSSSGSASNGTQVDISAAPVPANHPPQAAGAKTFTTTENHTVTLTRAYLVIASATIENTCGASFTASLQGILDFVIPSAAAHTTATPTSTGEPHVIDLLAVDTASIDIGSLSPPVNDYCGVRLDLLAADNDAVNLPTGPGEPDMIGKTIHIEGAYTLAGNAGSGSIQISTGASLSNRDVLLSALMMISSSSLNGQIDIAINYDTWFDAVDLATLETETATQTNPTDTNVGLVLQNITNSIHQM